MEERGGIAKVETFRVAHEEIVSVSLLLLAYEHSVEQVVVSWFMDTVGTRCCPYKTIVPNLIHPLQLTLGTTGIWRTPCYFS